MSNAKSAHSAHGTGRAPNDSKLVIFTALDSGAWRLLNFRR